MIKILVCLFIFLGSFNCSKKQDQELDLLFDEDTTTTAVEEQPTEEFEKVSERTSDNIATNDYEKYSEEGGRYVVQIGLYRKYSNAKKVKEIVEKKGIPVYIKKISNPTADLNDLSYFRVRVGPFGSKTNAMTFSEAHLSEYYFWVDIAK